MMKILVTGACGQLGFDICAELSRRGIEHRGADIADFDITDRAAAESYFDAYMPDALIHCSAWTAVDRAEELEERARDVNANGTRYLAECCRKHGAKMMYISTDYVFPGTGVGFYAPGDPTGPKNAYGRTKLEGELIVREALDSFFIVRTSWVFGKSGNNFVRTMLKAAETRSELSVVCDQIGSPTYTFDLAPLLCDMIASEKYGVYHATNEGICSWAEFAEAIFEYSGKMGVKVRPIPTSGYPTPAERPMNSRLSKEKLTEAGFYRLPTWRDALRRYLKELEV